MTADTKQPPEGEDLMVVYVGNDGKECVTHGFFQRGFWWVGFQQQKLMYDFVAWFPMPTRDRLAILDRYDEERAEWERRLNDAKENTEQWKSIYSGRVDDAEARADTAEEEARTLRSQVTALTEERDAAKKWFEAAVEQRDVALRREEDATAKTHAEVRAGYDKTIADSWRAKLAEVEARADRAEKERDEAVESATHAENAYRHLRDCGQESCTVVPGCMKHLHAQSQDVIVKRIDERDRARTERDSAIAERDEAREAWGRAESDACEWEEKAGVASADLATFTEKLHKAEQERDDLGCQLEALRAIQRDDVADLRMRMEAVEKKTSASLTLTALLAGELESLLTHEQIDIYAGGTKKIRERANALAGVDEKGGV